jgi:hypothetical protein
MRLSGPVRRIAGSGIVALVLASPASATLIVDTGPGPLSGGYVLGDEFGLGTRWLAAEFTLAGAAVLTSVEGWMWAFQGTPNVQAAIYTDGGEVPGSLLYTSAPFIPGATGESADWYGVSGLGWALGAGSWWVSFQADEDIAGMPYPSASPLSDYASRRTRFSTDWNADDSLGFGVRIEADPIPEPATLLLLASCWRRSESAGF